MILFLIALACSSCFRKNTLCLGGKRPALIIVKEDNYIYLDVPLALPSSSSLPSRPGTPKVLDFVPAAITSLARVASPHHLTLEPRSQTIHHLLVIGNTEGAPILPPP